MAIGALIYAFAISLVAGLMSTIQATPTTVSAELRSHLKNERFDIVTSIRGLPLGVRGAMQTLFASRDYDVQRDIAQPDAKFQGTDAYGADLPLRRLIAAECAQDHCLIYYERGGRALTWHVALFHWEPDATRLEAGGQLSRRLETIGEVWNALWSGALKDSAKVW